MVNKNSSSMKEHISCHASHKKLDIPKADLYCSSITIGIICKWQKHHVMNAWFDFIMITSFNVLTFRNDLDIF